MLVVGSQLPRGVHQQCGVPEVMAPALQRHGRCVRRLQQRDRLRGADENMQHDDEPVRRVRSELRLPCERPALRRRAGRLCRLPIERGLRHDRTRLQPGDAHLPPGVRRRHRLRRRDASHCDAATSVCVECTANTQCPAATPVCNARGACAQCTVDTDCPSTTPYCALGACIQCRTRADCPMATPMCELGACK